jgi:hypothetical protein
MTELYGNRIKVPSEISKGWYMLYRFWINSEFRPLYGYENKPEDRRHEKYKM